MSDLVPCPCTKGTQYALLAVSQVSDQLIAIYATGGIHFDATEAGIEMGDIFWGQKYPKKGIFVWEGNIEHGGPSIDGDYDVIYNGKFRAWNEDEALYVRREMHPWRCRLCNSTGLVSKPTEE